MGIVFFFDWEIKLITLFQSYSSTLLDAAATFFTLLGDEYLLIFFLGLLYWCIDKELGHRASLAFCAAVVFSTLIKGAAQRRRPYMDNSEIRCIRAAYPKEDIMSPVKQGFSLPSLHSSMSAAVYGTAAHERKKPLLIVLAILLPLLIGLSRIYLGVHFPTDVLSGWVIGTVLVFALASVLQGFGYKTGFVIVLIVGTAGFFYCRDIEFYSAYGITLGLLLGFLYEEKFVGFEKATKWWSYIVRPVLGVVIFALVSDVLKLLGAGIVNEGLALMYRLVRYAVSTFVIIGPYPQLFRKVKI